jgi:short-subunit dehydrogenase
MSRNVLVTGASDGIGLEIARQTVARGDKVLMVARDQAKLERAATGLRGAGIAETRAVDLADTQAIERFLADLDARDYRPDVLVNNAGQGLSGAFVDADAARIDQMLRLNMLAMTRLSHWAARGMKARRRGAIVNLSAAVATRPTPYFAAYAASKAYVTNLSQAMHSELKASGVTVSAIHPPAVRTSFADAEKADLRSTLVLKLFPTVGPATVARASLAAADRGRRFVTVGPVAGIVLVTAAIMPRGLDLAFMTLLFKGRRARGPSNQTMT